MVAEHEEMAKDWIAVTIDHSTYISAHANEPHCTTGEARHEKSRSEFDEKILKRMGNIHLQVGIDLNMTLPPNQTPHKGWCT